MERYSCQVQLNRYRVLISEKDCLDAILRFVSTRQDNTDYQKIVQLVHDTYLHRTISWWHYNLFEENKKEGLILWHNMWEPNDRIEALVWLSKKLYQEQQQSLKQD